MRAYLTWTALACWEAGWWYAVNSDEGQYPEDDTLFQKVGVAREPFVESVWDVRKLKKAMRRYPEKQILTRSYGKRRNTQRSGIQWVSVSAAGVEPPQTPATQEWPQGKERKPWPSFPQWRFAGDLLGRFAQTILLRVRRCSRALRGAIWIAGAPRRRCCTARRSN